MYVDTCTVDRFVGSGNFVVVATAAFGDEEKCWSGGSASMVVHVRTFDMLFFGGLEFS